MRYCPPSTLSAVKSESLLSFNSDFSQEVEDTENLAGPLNSLASEDDYAAEDDPQESQTRGHSPLFEASMPDVPTSPADGPVELDDPYATQPSFPVEQGIRRAVPRVDRVWGYLEPLNRELEIIPFERTKALYAIGRGDPREPEEGIDVLLPDDTISSLHCDIVWNGKNDESSRVEVRDYAKNGTWINSMRINAPNVPSNRDIYFYTALHDGDVLAFASPVRPPLPGERDNRYIYHHMASRMLMSGQSLLSVQGSAH